MNLEFKIKNQHKNQKDQRVTVQKIQKNKKTNMKNKLKNLALNSKNQEVIRVIKMQIG